jgi:cytochrome c553
MMSRAWLTRVTLLVLSCGPIAAFAAPPPEDSIAQRATACSACHGDQGRATRDGYYPRIAGKPAGYLYRQLLNFRTGVRHNAIMQQMLEYLSDDYLEEMAQYFSDQHPLYPPPVPSGIDAAALERGKMLALKGDPSHDLPACAACHGDTLSGVRPDLPGLLGLPRDYLVAQLGAWHSGTRKMVAPDCMAKVVERLSPSDVAAVTAWLSAQPVAAAAVPQDAPSQKRPLDCGAAP